MCKVILTSRFCFWMSEMIEGFCDRMVFVCFPVVEKIRILRK